MNAEGDAVEPETMTIDHCDPPHRLALTSTPMGEGNVWHFVLELAEADRHDDAHLQPVRTGRGAGGRRRPRLGVLPRPAGAAETGGDVAAIDFGDYHPAQSDQYRAMFG